MDETEQKLKECLDELQSAATKCCQFSKYLVNEKHITIAGAEILLIATQLLDPLNELKRLYSSFQLHKASENAKNN